MLEAKLAWGGEILAVSHVAPRAVVRLRDLGLPLVADDVVVARIDEGRLVPTPDLAFVVGRCSLHLSLVPQEKAPRRLTPIDGRVFPALALASVLHALVLAIAFVGRGSAGDSEQRAFEALRTLVERAEEHAHAEVVLPKFGSNVDPAGGSAAKNDEGAAGNPARVDEGARRRKTQGDNRERTVPGEERTFGMIALLQGHHAGSSAFADDVGRGAMGNIFGATIDDAAGAGGLGLSGDGEGGGGLGAGISLDRIATSAGPGTGVGQGFGTCHCRLGGTHIAKAPLVVEAETRVSGRLPPEAIQRIVRQSFGRLRACYQAGLDRDPSLEGRIAVKFVIDRDGEVTMASVAERTLPDVTVATCVAQTYEAMTFPKPAGGIVTVVYPVVFEKS